MADVVTTFSPNPVSTPFRTISGALLASTGVPRNLIRFQGSQATAGHGAGDTEEFATTFTLPRNFVYRPLAFSQTIEGGSTPLGTYGDDIRITLTDDGGSRFLEPGLGAVAEFSATNPKAQRFAGIPSGQQAAFGQILDAGQGDATIVSQFLNDDAGVVGSLTVHVYLIALVYDINQYYDYRLHVSGNSVSGT